MGGTPVESLGVLFRETVFGELPFFGSAEGAVLAGTFVGGEGDEGCAGGGAFGGEGGIFGLGVLSSVAGLGVW